MWRGRSRKSIGTRRDWSDFAVLYRQHGHREELVRNWRS